MSANVQLKAEATLDTKGVEQGVRRINSELGKVKKTSMPGPDMSKVSGTKSSFPAGAIFGRDRSGAPLPFPGTEKKGTGGGVPGGLPGVGKLAGGIFAVAAVIEGAKAIANYTLALAEESLQAERTAKTLGISAGTLDELKDAAERTGASGEGFVAKLVKLVDSQESAILGNKGAAESFKRLGISVQDLTSLTPEKLFERVAQGARSDGAAISDLNNVMGKGAANEFSEVLKDIGANGLPGMNAQVDQSIHQFAEMEKKIISIKDKFKDMFMAGAVKIGQIIGLAPSDEEDRKRQEKEAYDNFVKNRERLKQLAEERKKAQQEDVVKVEKRAEKAKEDALKSITVDAPKASDQFARLGAMIGGGAADRTRGAVERQIKVAEAIKKINEDMAADLKEITDNTAILKDG
jgi:hypothetical protein